MKTPHWLQRLFPQLAKPFAQRPARRNKVRMTYRLLLESLEDRILLWNNISIVPYTDNNIYWDSSNHKFIAAGQGASLSIPTLQAQLLVTDVTIDASDISITNNNEAGAIYGFSS